MQEIQTGGIMITTTEGTQLKTTTTIYWLQQLVDEPTNIRKNSSSCIDLIFTNQSNVIVSRRTHLSLHEIVNTKLPLLRSGLELNDRSWTRIQNHLVRKRTLNH